MKKHFLIIIALIIFTVFTVACSAVEQEVDAPSGLEESDDLDYSRVQIGISLAGTGAFYDQLSEDIRLACEKLDYEANIVVADNGAKQQSDVLSMVSAGAAVVVIDPVDVDVFESVLADCETAGVPVISIIDQINGSFSTLLSPDYQQIGETVGQRAAALFPQGEGRCLELKSDYDSFIMQLMSDGFEASVSDNEGIEIVADVFCGYDEEKAFTETKNNILLNDVNFVFAHNAALAKGALRAIEESGKSVHLVVYGGEMDLLRSVQSGKLDTAIFFGTKDLTDIIIGIADEFIKSATYTPDPYVKLKIDAVTADNVAGYISDLLYAQVKEDE